MSKFFKMAQHSQLTLSLCISLFIFMSARVSSIDELQETAIKSDIEPITTGAVGGETQATAREDMRVPSLVKIDSNKNNHTLDVHVPVVFDMTRQADAAGGQSKLDLSVLRGLVKVTRDRPANGFFGGPLTVSVLGIPIYTRQGASSEGKTSAEPLVSITGSNSAHEIYHNAKRINENLKNSIVGYLNRTATFIRQQSQSTATEAGDLVGQASSATANVQPSVSTATSNSGNLVSY